MRCRTCKAAFGPHLGKSGRLCFHNVLFRFVRLNIAILVKCHYTQVANECPDFGLLFVSPGSKMGCPPVDLE
jgi:hypothetical protein